MNRRIIAPLVMLATITTLTSCVTRDVAPTVTPVSTGTETPAVKTTPVVPTTEAPVPEMPTPTPPPSVEPLSGATTETPSVSQTTTKVMTYQSPAGLDEIEFSATVDK